MNSPPGAQIASRKLQAVGVQYTVYSPRLGRARDQQGRASDSANERCAQTGTRTGDAGADGLSPGIRGQWEGCVRSRDEGSRTGPTRTARGDRARGGGWGRETTDRDGRIRACYVLGRRHVRTWQPDLIELAAGRAIGPVWATVLCMCTRPSWLPRCAQAQVEERGSRMGIWGRGGRGGLEGDRGQGRRVETSGQGRLAGRFGCLGWTR